MNDNNIKQLLQQIKRRPIAYQCAYAELSGSVAAGVFLSQACYWAERTDDPEGWFFKTQSEWTDETFLSRREQETARKSLKEIGVLEEKRVGCPAKLFYRINDDALIEGLLKLKTRRSRKQDCSNRANQYGENEQSSMAENANLDCTNPTNNLYTEITSEITSEREERTRTSDQGNQNSLSVNKNSLNSQTATPPNSAPPPLNFAPSAAPIAFDGVRVSLINESAVIEAFNRHRAHKWLSLGVGCLSGIVLSGVQELLRRAEGDHDRFVRELGVTTAYLAKQDWYKDQRFNPGQLFNPDGKVFLGLFLASALEAQEKTPKQNPSAPAQTEQPTEHEFEGFYFRWLREQQEAASAATPQEAN